MDAILHFLVNFNLNSKSFLSLLALILGVLVFLLLRLVYNHWNAYYEKLGSLRAEKEFKSRKK